jgi:uncharacterized membrane protein YedE/YeeE
MNVPDFLAGPWPWYVSGPLLGLVPPLLLLLGNKVFGFSSNLRHACAALAPGRVEFFRYDWPQAGGWNLLFLAGTLAGGFVAVHVLGTPDVAISEATRASLTSLGLHDLGGLVPREIFDAAHLFSLRGLVLVAFGGVLVGFGTAYAGGCTSGHAISGLADLQPASLVAVLGFFAGGLLATHVLLPLVLGP